MAAASIQAVGFSSSDSWLHLSTQKRAGEADTTEVS